MAVSPLRLLYLGHSELAVRTVSLELHLVPDLVLAGALLIAPGGNARAVFLSPGLSRIDGLSAIEFVQDKQKSETVKQKVRRIWRNPGKSDLTFRADPSKHTASAASHFLELKKHYLIDPHQSAITGKGARFLRSRRQPKAFEPSFNLFEHPILACRAKGNHMRTLVEPPPSSRCDLCGGELRLKLIESANRTLDLENEISVCVKCGHEQSNIVKHDPNMPHTKVA